MTFDEFHNGLRALLDLRRRDLVNAGIMAAKDHNAWGTFRRNPFLYFIRLPNAPAARMWRLIARHSHQEGADD